MSGTRALLLVIEGEVVYSGNRGLHLPLAPRRPTLGLEEDQQWQPESAGLKEGTEDKDEAKACAGATLIVDPRCPVLWHRTL